MLGPRDSTKGLAEVGADCVGAGGGGFKALAGRNADAADLSDSEGRDPAGGAGRVIRAPVGPDQREGNDRAWLPAHASQ